MIDMEALFRAIDTLTAEEKQQIVAYIEERQPEGESTPCQPRTPGLFPGIWMSEDFDAELPDSFWFGDNKASSR